MQPDGEARHQGLPAQHFCHIERLPTYGTKSSLVKNIYCARFAQRKPSKNSYHGSASQLLPHPHRPARCPQIHQQDHMGCKPAADHQKITGPWLTFGKNALAAVTTGCPPLVGYISTLAKHVSFPKETLSRACSEHCVQPTERTALRRSTPINRHTHHHPRSVPIAQNLRKSQPERR